MRVVVTAVGPNHWGLADPILHYITSVGASIAEVQMYDHAAEGVFAMMLRCQRPGRRDTLAQLRARMAEIGADQGYRSALGRAAGPSSRPGSSCVPPSPNYSRPAPQGCRWGASSPPATHLWPVSAPEAHRPLTPIWGRHGDGLSNGSASRMGHGEREGGTQALAHSTIPLQVRPA